MLLILPLLPGLQQQLVAIVNTDEFFNNILRTVIQSVIIYTYPLKGQLWINIRVNIRTNKF